MRTIQVLAVALLGLITVAIWLQVLAREPSSGLKVVFLNVGQGDAVFIETPSRQQILIDGGARSDVLRELGDAMSFFDRSIDVVIATHPDIDHIGGLVPVLQRYTVDTFIHSGLPGSSGTAEALTHALKQRNVATFVAERGQVLNFGDGAALRILFPDRKLAAVDPNLGSVVVQLVFGEHEFLFTGDAPDEIEEYVVTLDEDLLASEVLKVGHHGSRTSSSETFLGYVQPTYGIVSRGCNNRYGHPHEDVVARLHRFEVTVLDTCIDGRVTVISDGVTLHVEGSP